MHRKCRLCLNTNQLIDVFHPLLFTAKKLRFYIFLCTGVNIQSCDIQSKYVCFNCCKVAIKFYNYRKSAMENNSEQRNCRNELEPNAMEHDSSSNGDFEEHNDESFRILSESIESACERNKRKETSKFHWSVVELFKKIPKIIIPNQILNTHIKPVVVLRKIDAAFMKEKVNVYKCASIPKRNRREFTKKLLLSRCESESEYDSDAEFSNTTPERRTGQNRRRISSECLEIIPLKKKRLFTKESIALQKIDLPEKQPSDVESKKMIFTSSLELTPTRFRTLPNKSILVPLEAKLTCGYCGKSYKNFKALKSHIRRHRKCVLCNKMCSAEKSLSDHLRDVCYKKLKENQPFVRLKRETFSSPSEDQNAAENVTPEDCCRTSAAPNQNASDVVIRDCAPEVKNESDSRCLPREITYLKSIFKKYENAVSKSAFDKKCTDSEWADGYVEYCKDPIILNNMFGDLSVYICTP